MAERTRPKRSEYDPRIPPEPPPQVDQTFRGGEQRTEYLRGTAFTYPPDYASKAEVEHGHRVAAVGQPLTAAEMTAAAPEAPCETYGVPPAKFSDRYPSISKEDKYRGYMKPK